jgi:hypothetical protein
VNGRSGNVVWVNRLVLAAAAAVMTTIALRHLRDPTSATAAAGIVLGSPSAATVVRVGFGGFPLGFAVALFGCLLTRRLLTGLFLVLAVVGAATLARVQGLWLDGATPYNLGLLRPEIAMVTASVVGIVLELRRRRVRPADGETASALNGADIDLVTGERLQADEAASRPSVRR